MDEQSEAADVDEIAKLTGDISTEMQQRQRLRSQAQALAAALLSHPLQPVRIHGEQVDQRETIEAELAYLQGEQERVEQLLSDYCQRLQRLLRPPPAAYQCSVRIRRSKQFQGVRRLLYEDAERHFAFCIGGAHSACIRYGSDSDSDSDLRVRLGFREREHARRFEDRLCAMRRGEIMDALRGAIQELQVSDIPAAALRERVRADQYDPRAAPGSPPPPPRWCGSDQRPWETVVDACNVSIPASSETSSGACTESDEVEPTADVVLHQSIQNPVVFRLYGRAHCVRLWPIPGGCAQRSDGGGGSGCDGGGGGSNGINGGCGSGDGGDGGNGGPGPGGAAADDDPENNRLVFCHGMRNMFTGALKNGAPNIFIRPLGPPSPAVAAEGGRSEYRVAIEYTSDEAGEFLKLHLKDGVQDAKNDLGLPEMHTSVSVRDPQAFGAYLRRYYVQAKSKRLRL